MKFEHVERGEKRYVGKEIEKKSGGKQKKKQTKEKMVTV